MSLLKNKNNKIYLPENTLIFENSGTKIVTGVNPTQAEDDMIGDQVINPGDTVITTEGKQLVKNPNGSYTDLSNPSSGPSTNDIALVEETQAGQLGGPIQFDALFDFDETLYTSVNGVLEIFIDDAIPFRALYTVYSLYDFENTMWVTTLSIVTSNGNNLPDGVSINVNTDGILEYEANVAAFTSITAKFRATVL